MLPLPYNLARRARGVTDGDRSIAQRLAVPVSIAVAVFTFVLLQVLHRLIPATGADFRAMLKGAQDITLGHDLYGPAIQFLGSGHLRTILQMPVTLYVYPPPLAILLRPLNNLPPAVALTLWDAVNVALLAVLYVQIVRLSRAESMRELVLVSAVYGFYPLNMGLGMGQVDILLTLLGFMSYIQYRAGHTVRSGIMLGCMTLVKPTVGILLVFFVARRAWPILLPFLLTLAAGAAASIAAVGAQVLWEYRTVAFGWSEQFGVLPLNQSLHGLVLRVLSPHLDRPPTGLAQLLATALEVLAFLVCAGVVIRLLRHGEPKQPQDGALQFYAAFSVLLLGLPFTENLHFTWLLPGLGLLLVAMAKERRWSLWHPVLICAYLTLALPFAEMVCWSAGTSWTGRLSSSVETYSSVVLALVFCRFSFGSLVATKRQQRRTLLLRSRENAA